MVHVFLVIWINPLLLLVSSLSLLHFSVLNLGGSKVILHFSIIQNLCPSYFFQLHSIEFILIFFLKTHHSSFSQLLFSLEVNLIDLVLFKSFEMIWFNSMVSKHAHFSLWIFSHEIVIVSEFNFSFLLSGPFIVHDFIVV